MNVVPTRSSQVRQNSFHNFQIVVHEKHKSKTADKRSSAVENKSHNKFSEADMKKARFEVYKFSKSNLDFLGKQKSKVELAIQLGAIPPKNKGRNYKEILAEKKIEKERMEKENMEQFHAKQRYKIMKIKNNLNRSIKQKANKGHQNGILGIYGKAKLNLTAKKTKR